MVCGEDMEGNLTKGPILKTLTKLAIPIMASSFLGTLYNLTDMAWIGLLGSKAVAGVGVGGMYTWLSQGLASMARMGGQVQVAQHIGKGNRDEANKYAQTAVQLATLMGLAYAAIVLLFLHQLIGFFQLNDAEAIVAAFSYTRIACGLIVFSFLTFTLTGIYTAQGDSKTPFIANLIGLVINMILDPVLILGPGPLPELGVAGAAIATVTAQGIVMSVMIIGIFVQKKDNVLKGIRLFARIPIEYVSGICKIGIPTALQGMAYCVISMVLARMVSVFGAEAVAVQRVGGQIESLSWNTADGFAAALNAFVGQNYGANKMDRVKKGYRASLWTVGIWGLIIGDAVGVPYEFTPQEDIPSIDKIDIVTPTYFRKTYIDVPFGTYSDDGAQFLCVIDSYLECDGFNMNNLAKKLLEWLSDGLWAVDGLSLIHI